MKGGWTVKAQGSPRAPLASQWAGIAATTFALKFWTRERVQDLLDPSLTGNKVAGTNGGAF